MSDYRIDDLLSPPDDPPVPMDVLPRILAIPSRVSLVPVRRLVAAAAAILLFAVLWTGYERIANRPTPPPVVRTPQLTVRERITLALAGPLDRSLVDELGERALPSLHRAAVGDDTATARAAIGWMGAIGHPRSLPTLIEAADLPDRERAAAIALTAIGPRALPALVPLLSRPGTSDVAVEAISSIGGRRAVDALAVAIATTEDRIVRRNLIESLARVDGRRGAQRLLALLKDRSTGSDALSSLFASRDRLRPALEELAAGRDVAVARAAIGALALLADPASIPVLSESLEDRTRRTPAARALARIDTAEAADSLLLMAGDPAIRSACLLGGRGLEVRFLERLRSANPADRTDLIALLGVVGGNRSIPALLRLADEPATSPQAIAALGRIGTFRAIRSLASLAEDPHFRRLAIRALGESGSVAAVPALVRIGRRHRGVRQAASRALALIPSDQAAEAIDLLERDGGLRRDSRRARAGPPRSVSLM